MIRSPFFYVGDKYKLMPQIIKHFPKRIENYIEPFVGGGSSFLYVNANKYHMNDIDVVVMSEFNDNIKKHCEMPKSNLEKCVMLNLKKVM